jgi:hypothetical protein
LSLVPDTSTVAIATAVAGMSQAQVREVRDRITAEVRQLELSLPERTPLDSPGVFELTRAKATIARRRREIEYLNRLLARRGARGT